MELRFAKEQVAAGADLILGHHAHILKGIEVYKGKVIFYSLCNFALDVPVPPGHEALNAVLTGHPSIITVMKFGSKAPVSSTT